jgi:PAS domain S-box-containing protein
MATGPDDLRRENEELKNRLAQVERIVAIVEASSAAIISMATDDTIVCWNAAAERLYGFSSGEAIGRSALELVPFDRLAEHRDAIERANRGVPVALHTRRRRHDGGQISVAIIYARLADPTNNKLLGISTIAHPLPPG